MHAQFAVRPCKRADLLRTCNLLLSLHREQMIAAPVMHLSVVIPAWNEERRVERAIVASTAEAQTLGHEFEIVAVDDGSGDRTADVITRCAGRDPRVRLLRLPAHQGKGAAVREGVLSALGEFVFFLDADLSTPPAAIAAALPLLQNGADVVRGSRHCHGARVLRRQKVVRRVLGRAFLSLTRAWVDPRATDLTCGFKGFRRAAARAIFVRCRMVGWAFDAETAWLARRLGFVTREIPVQWSDDPDSRVRLPAATLQSLAGLGQLLFRDLHDRVSQPRLRRARHP